MGFFAPRRPTTPLTDLARSRAVPQSSDNKAPEQMSGQQAALKAGPRPGSPRMRRRRSGCPESGAGAGAIRRYRRHDRSPKSTAEKDAH